MSQRTTHPVNSASSWFSSMGVLAVFAAIGWWGHINHWDFAHAFGLAGNSHAEASSHPPAAAAPRTSVTADGSLSVPTDLPKIEFTSAEGAKNCGLDTAVVQDRPMDDYVTTSAVVGYDESKVAQLATRVAGTVASVEKRLGDYVERGQPLVIIDSAEVGEAKANLLEACVLYNLKSRHVERLSQITNAIAGRELIEAEAASELARTQRFNAVQKLINLGFNFKLDELQSLSADELAARLHLLGLPPSYEKTTESYNLIAVSAPFSGIVTKCDVVRGEAVEPLTPFYVVADVRHMWIHLNVRQDDAPKLKIGTPVIFESEMKTNPVKAVLTWIGTEIDPRTRTIQARAEADNPLMEDAPHGIEAGLLLQAGSFGSAKILTRSQPIVATIPDSALHWQWEIGQEVVFVADPDGRTFIPRVVKKGLVRDGYVQIMDGLKPGERIVTTGSRILSAELSEHLQEHFGENAAAVRTFHHAHDTHQDTAH
ncbi:efflux RND transporter periplasmic adaptor subunit [Planctomicrobium piriforme]|uniref:RND family efflux transporter, MFP subunit n=1 Tax=Planctomicrobium piriforme TaxID=1576369 RepID=A0A1I3QQA0_9PLAN|nr:efflux RND transporter periplasmic adaptor subunit [Planctomicrobium piriforme]SFJ35960.1 RND family efflux transporter, MFP subunit [Planctomicrobium piriforme]